MAGGHLDVGEDRVDLPRFAVGAVDPHLVLQREATGDLVFDRGCYHCCRRVDLDGYLATLRNVTRPGTVYLSLSGNANEQTEQGPPRVTEEEIRAELGGVFEVQQLRAFRFEDPGGVDGPLGWSCVMVRREEEQR